MQECDECTLCCKLLETHGIKSSIEEYCEECLPDAGCSIHETRPEECRKYFCMWVQMESVGIELRPDKSGIIFDKMCDDVICARLEKGRKMNDLVFGQVNNFIDNGFSVMIFRDRENKIFLAGNHTEEYVIGKINGRS